MTMPGDATTAPDPCPVAMRGIVASLNTPFRADGSLDEASLGRLVDETVASGCVGILSTAVAAEMTSLTLEERERVTRIVCETAADRIPVIVSVTAATLDDSVALTRIARAANASRDGLLAHFSALTRDAPQFLMIQDLDWSGGGLALDDISYLFETLPAFTCLKIEAVPAGPKYSSVLDATGGRLHVSGGWAASQMMDGLARGVHAFIPTALHRIWTAIYRRWHEGDEDGARALFEQLLPIIAFSNQHIDISIRFLKRLRKAEGVFETDVCRPPVSDFDRFHSAEADRLMARAIALEASLKTRQGEDI